MDVTIHASVEDEFGDECLAECGMDFCLVKPTEDDARRILAILFEGFIERLKAAGMDQKIY